MTPSPWAGRVLLLPGVMVYAGPIAPTSPHQHHATQLLLAPDGINLAGPDGRFTTYTAALIPADTEHTLRSMTPEGRLVLIDPASSYHQRLAHRTEGIQVLAELTVDVVASQVSAPLSMAWLDELLARCGSPSVAPVVFHPGVRRVQQALAERLDGGDLDLASLAAVAKLSEGRLVHAFREQVGLPIRPYVLWLRMQRAARSLGLGRTITEAAHEAGFADASHLSRTFRRMFVLVPSDLAGWVEWVDPS